MKHINSTKPHLYVCQNGSETYGKDPHGFMHPKGNDSFFCFALLGVCLKNSLNDFAKIAEIERVMRLCRGGKKLLPDGVVNFNASSYNVFTATLDVHVEEGI